MYLKLLFVFSISLAHDAPEIGQTISTSTHLISKARQSPYLACNLKKSFAENQTKERWYDLRIPNKDLSGTKSRDFFKALHTKIGARIKESEDLSMQINICFKPPYIETNSSSCREIRSWFNPIKYPSKNEHEVRDSLFYNLKKARANLALASEPLIWGRQTTVNDMNSIFKPNADLKSFGFKSVPWQALTPNELKNAENQLERYKQAFKKRHEKTLPNGQKDDLTDEELNSLLPYDRLKRENQIYANPMNLSQEEISHQISQSDMSDIRTDLIDQMLLNIRAGHLNEYLKIVSQYPIMNYLSSPDPSLKEIQEAGQKMYENAVKETQNIKRVGALLNNPNHADDIINHNSILDLLDYRSIVEELLTERPEFCAVATTAELHREKVEVSKSMVMLPVLAATFFMPLVPATLLATGTGSIFTYNAYKDFTNQQQGAYLMPINRGARSDQYSIDAAQKEFKLNLTLMPVDLFMGGAFSQTRKIFRKPRNILPAKQ